MKVPAGWSTYVGYGLTALGIVATAVATAEHELSGHGKWLALITAGIAVATNALRSIQAIFLSKETPVVDELAAGTSPTWATQPAPPDGVDSAQVPRAVS